MKLEGVIMDPVIPCFDLSVMPLMLEGVLLTSAEILVDVMLNLV
jgi:hypothetical protein